MTYLDPSKMTRVRDLPEKLGVSRSTVYGWFKKGLRRIRLGGTLYVTHEELARFHVPEPLPPPVPTRPRKSKTLARLEAMEAKRKKNSKRNRRKE